MSEVKKKKVITDPYSDSISKTYRRKLFSKFLAAINDYQLINDNDTICVCISGGKDSMLMAKIFMLYNKYVNNKVTIKYLVMNPGYNEINLQTIKNNLKILNIPAVIEETNIFEIANSQEKSPCYLCAKMRRGALYRIAKEMGCNKIALGHHYDDVIETTLMNMLNAGSFQTMLPKVHSDNYSGMELIRPMYYIREQDIINWKTKNNLKFIQCACRFTENCAICDNGGGGSKRYETKLLIKKLTKEMNEHVEQNIFNAANNVILEKILGYKDETGHHSFLENYKDLIKEDN